MNSNFYTKDWWINMTEFKKTSTQDIIKLIRLNEISKERTDILDEEIKCLKEIIDSQDNLRKELFQMVKRVTFGTIIFQTVTITYLTYLFS